MQVQFGEETRIVGSIPALGGWDVKKAPKMAWNDGHVWSLELEVPSDSSIEFKVSCADPPSLNHSVDPPDLPSSPMNKTLPP